MGFSHNFQHFQGQYLHAGELHRTARIRAGCNLRVAETHPITETDFTIASAGAAWSPEQICDLAECLNMHRLEHPQQGRPAFERCGKHCSTYFAIAQYLH